MKIHYYSLTEFIIITAMMMVPVTIIPKNIEFAYVKSDKIQCQMHLSRIWAATTLYTETHHHFLPHEDTGNSKPPYRSSWTQVLDTSPHEMGLFKGPSFYDLKMNSRLEDYQGRKSSPSPPFRSLLTIPKPHFTPYIFDGRTDGWYQNKMYGSPTSVAPRHDLEANFLFLDGHVESVFETPNPKGGWMGHGNLMWDPEAAIKDQRL